MLASARSLIVLMILGAVASVALAQPPTLRTIRVDGDVSDWSPVLVNPTQVTRDGDGSRIDCSGSQDRDCPVQSSGRDLRLFAWTHDSTHVYVYVERQGSTTNTETFWFYMDLDDDGLMEAGEKVWRVVYKGSGGTTTGDVYRYTSVVPAGDPMVDASGFADGYTIPGTLGLASLYTEGAPNGGTPGGNIFEERLPWSVIGVAPGTVIGFHVASSNSQNPGSVSAQIDDNLGRLGGGGASFATDDVSVTPSRSGFIAPGGSILYAHDVTNLGTRRQAFALRGISSIGTSVAFYSDPNNDGAPDALIARDVNGDGDFIDVGDFLDPSWDADGDGFPTTTILGLGEIFHLVVEVSAGLPLDGQFDVLSVEAFLPTDPQSVTASAIDTTHIGLVIVRFDQSRTAMPGQPVSYPVQVCNNDAATQTFDLSARSTLGSSVSLFADADCNGTADTYLARDDQGDGVWDDVSGGDSDGDGLPDSGSLASGRCACFVLRVTSPAGAALGDLDVTTLTAQALPAGLAAGSARLTTRIAEQVEISPDYLVADSTQKFAAPGTPVFFPHVVRNNGGSTNRINFTTVAPSNDLGWTIVLWSDPNGDGSIADGMVITQTGVIAANGGTYSFVVELRVPTTVTTGVISTTTITGTSSFDPSVRATATDQAIVSTLTTYSDPLFSFATVFFAPCDVIYTLGTGLRARGDYELVYSDGSNRTVRVVTLVADDAGVIEDSYQQQPGDVVGSWLIEIRSAGSVIDRRALTVESFAQVSALATDRSRYPLSGADLVVTSSIQSDNTTASFLNTRIEYLLLDPTRTAYFDLSTGSFRPYSGTELTRTTDVSRLDAGGSLDDPWSSPLVTYPREGIYCLAMKFISSCGTVLANSGICFTVGAGVEQCANGIDDDGDGLADCLDPECGLDPACAEDLCTNGIDDDGDTMVDCVDPDCEFDRSCQEDCLNGIDDDLDSLVDCRDPDCAASPACTETNCTNGIDDDRDGLVDCGDPDCAGDPTCVPETICDDGIDNDLDTAVDCADTDCAADIACEGIDSDGDTVPNVSDCAPLDPGDWSVPTNIPLLRVTHGVSGYAYLAWTDMRAQAGPAVVYDVVTGLVSELWADRDFSRSECFARGRLINAAADTRPILAERDAFYYLIRGDNSCGIGPWGFDSFGVERVATVLCSSP